MRVVMVYSKRLVVPDGEACDRCPRPVGLGGRYVKVLDGQSAKTMQLCSVCVAAVRKTADHVSVAWS